MEEEEEESSSVSSESSDSDDSSSTSSSSGSSSSDSSSSDVSSSSSSVWCDLDTSDDGADVVELCVDSQQPGPPSDCSSSDASGGKSEGERQEERKERRRGERSPAERAPRHGSAPPAPCSRAAFAARACAGFSDPDGALFWRLELANLPPALWAAVLFSRGGLQDAAPPRALAAARARGAGGVLAAMDVWASCDAASTRAGAVAAVLASCGLEAEGSSLLERQRALAAALQEACCEAIAHDERCRGGA
jgi:hypothetical protein